MWRIHIQAMNNNAILVNCKPTAYLHLILEFLTVKAVGLTDSINENYIRLLIDMTIPLWMFLAQYRQNSPFAERIVLKQENGWLHMQSEFKWRITQWALSCLYTAGLSPDIILTICRPSYKNNVLLSMHPFSSTTCVWDIPSIMSMGALVYWTKRQVLWRVMDVIDFPGPIAWHEILERMNTH